MLLDTELTFGEIDRGPVTVGQQLLELQDFLEDGDERHVWATSLRFLTPFHAEPRAQGREKGLSVAEVDGESRGRYEEQDVGMYTRMEEAERLQETKFQDFDSMLSLSHESSRPASNCSWEPCLCEHWENYSLTAPRSLTLEERDAAPGCAAYLAISYCWQSHKNDEQSSGTLREPGYLIHTATGVQLNKAPTEILQRAIAYAASYGLRCIWIDQECINQNDNDDKETAIQSMDFVYQRTRNPLGLLESRIEHQRHIDVFELLYQGELLTCSQMADLAELLHLFANEIWFTRAWILQESTAGGPQMQLLLRHASTLRKVDYFGEIPGELTFSISEFLECLCFADVCVDHWSKEMSCEIHDGLETSLKRIWTFLPTFMPTSYKTDLNDPEFRQTCNAAQALTFLRNRKNDRIMDRLAIIANLCGYGRRLNTIQIERRQYSFSVCVLALALFNGDVSLLDAYPNAMSSIPVIYSWGPPESGRLDECSYIEENEHIFRYNVGLLTSKGLLVHGWLWETKKTIDLRMVRAHFLEPWLSGYIHDAEDGDPGKSMILKVDFIWYLIKALLQSKFERLADLIWKQTRNIHIYEDTKLLSIVGDTPTSLFETVDRTTGELIFRCPPTVNSEEDYREFYQGNLNNYFTPWFIRDIMDHGCLSYSQLTNTSVESFDQQESSLAMFERAEGEGDLVFVPSSDLDDLISAGRNPQADRALWWHVHVVGKEPCGDGVTTLLKCRSRAKGYWSVRNSEESSFHVLM